MCKDTTNQNCLHEEIKADLIEGMPATVSPDTRVFPFAA